MAFLLRRASKHLPGALFKIINFADFSFLIKIKSRRDMSYGSLVITVIKKQKEFHKISYSQQRQNHKKSYIVIVWKLILIRTTYRGKAQLYQMH